MKKFIKILSIMLCLFMFIGCNEGKLSDYYDEDEVKTASEDIINKLNNKNYSDILKNGSEEFNISFPDNKLQEYWEGFNKNIGDFDSITKMTLVEKNGYAVAIVNAKYTKKRVTFTLYFNKDSKLSGIHMK